MSTSVLYSLLSHPPPPTSLNDFGLKSDSSDIETEDLTSLTKEQLVKLNLEMRSKIEEENQSYKRKLQTFQESQSRQAQLVQKLQQKVNCI